MNILIELAKRQIKLKRSQNDRIEAVKKSKRSDNKHFSARRMIAHKKVISNLKISNTLHDIKLPIDTRDKYYKSFDKEPKTIKYDSSNQDLFNHKDENNVKIGDFIKRNKIINFDRIKQLAKPRFDSCSIVRKKIKRMVHNSTFEDVRSGLTFNNNINTKDKALVDIYSSIGDSGFKVILKIQKFTNFLFLHI
jgi:hypothetical protein